MAKVAIPLAAGFEDSEFSVPYERLQRAGHEVVVFGTKAGESLIGKRGKTGRRVDQEAASLEPSDFDALVIPGGNSPALLRLDGDVLSFVRRFSTLQRPVAAICHGPQLLSETDLVRGKALTSWPSVRRDLINAGANWVDEEVVVDDNLITSQGPDDLPAFCDALLTQLGQ